ncbi:hypothetical protein J437_LFUL003796 [Ladona fulva]|uniref:Queuine tRNA-ribosyltransferase accessory subunit 2 n=1 Tax=Ladona fulva TaxID=123851 RepID=A0A8K0JYL8_LADFU|nr:hypothetical protein J437_LFUL003796 [Ladona fulva]
MKFVIDTISNSSLSRIGTLKNFHRLPQISFETPILFMYSKGGCIPHLTHDVLQYVSKEYQAIQVPLPSTISCHHPLTKSQEGIADFIGMREYLVYCSVQDPAIPSPAGYNTMDKVSIWCKSGKEHVDSDRYMDIMEAFKPDIYQCLGDGETNVDSTNKRIQKSIKRSLHMFHRCLERHKKSEALKNSAFIALLQGGYDVEERVNYAKEIAGSPIDGFVIDGLHDNSPGVEFFDFDKVKPIVTESVKEFPEDKLRIVHGCWSPETVLKLVELGIDAFDSSFPFAVTERGAALTFPYKASDVCDADVNHKVPVTEDFVKEEHSYEINLGDSKYTEDFQPILKDCQCLCCKKHTRAYINHLLLSKELLARVLLMM